MQVERHDSNFQETCVQLFRDHTDYSLTGSSCLWNSPGKSTGVGSHFLLQGIFLTQGWNPCLLNWLAGNLPLSIGAVICHYTSDCAHLDFPSLL